MTTTFERVVSEGQRSSIGVERCRSWDTLGHIHLELQAPEHVGWADGFRCSVLISRKVLLVLASKTPTQIRIYSWILVNF